MAENIIFSLVCCVAYRGNGLACGYRTNTWKPFGWPCSLCTIAPVAATSKRACRPNERSPWAEQFMCVSLKLDIYPSMNQIWEIYGNFRKWFMVTRKTLLPESRTETFGMMSWVNVEYRIMVFFFFVYLKKNHWYRFQKQVVLYCKQNHTKSLIVIHTLAVPLLSSFG